MVSSKTETLIYFPGPQICPLSHQVVRVFFTRIQYLKSIFEMANYRSPVYTVATVWAAKAAQRYRDPRRAAWHHDVVDPMHPEFTLKLCAMSLPTKRACLREDPISSRQLVSFTRGRLQISLREWVLVTTGGMTVVGHVSEMIQLSVTRSEFDVVSVVRIMLLDVVIPEFDADERISMNVVGSGACMYISLECAHVSLLLYEQLPEGFLLQHVS